MTTNEIDVICRWGGNMLRNDNGIFYEGGQCIEFVLTPTTTYKGLLTHLRKVMGLKPRLHKVGLICRNPVIEGSKLTFERLTVNNDEGLRRMYESGLQNSWQGSVELYLFVGFREDPTTVQPTPIIPVGNQSGQVLQPNPIYNPTSLLASIDNSYVGQGSGSSLFQTSAHTSFLPYASTSREGQGSGAQYAHHQETESGSQTQQETTADLANDLVIECHPSNIARVRNMTLGHAEEDDEEEEPDVEDDEEAGVHDGAGAWMEPPSTYFTDISGFQADGHWEPTFLTRSSVFNPTVDELRKGLVFDDKHALQDAVARYHMSHHVELKVVGSNKSKWEVRCKSDDDLGCRWRLRGSLQKHGRWEIVTYNGLHTCLMKDFSVGHPQLTAGFIARQIRHLIKVDPAYKIALIRADLEERLNISAGYYKTWYAKQIAIADCFGDWDSSYADLPRFLLAVQENNPGTAVAWETRPSPNPGNVMFDRIFWAFKPCIDGFKFCRPIVSIDATFLYGKYSGNLLIAMAKDGADKLFPLAFAVVEKENQTNWAWFLRLVRLHVAKDRMDLCIIADRHKGILAAINDENNGWGALHGAHHRFCLRHVMANFYKKFPDSTLKELIWDAGSATCVEKFNAFMKEFEEKDTSERKQALAWINNLPVEKWTLAHDGGRRYGELTTNISESFNGVLRAGRFLPITACVQVIFFRLVDLYEANRKEALDWRLLGHTLGPHGVILLEKVKKEMSRNHCRVYNSNIGEGVVATRGSKTEYIVHLRDRKCSCGWWEAYHFPCSHAMSMCKATNKTFNVIIPAWCSLTTYDETWASQFHPVRNSSYWAPWVGDVWTPNPALLRGKGRRRESRIENEMDRPTNPREARHCRSCGKEGHNRRKCPTKVDQRPATMSFAHGFQDY